MGSCLWASVGRSLHSSRNPHGSSRSAMAQYVGHVRSELEGGGSSVPLCSAVGQIWQYCEWKERGRGSGATLLQFQCKRGKEKGGWGGWLNRSSLTPPCGLLSEL